MGALTRHGRVTRRQFARVATVAAGAVLLSDLRAIAQEPEIRIGTLMPLTGAGGSYGGDMQKAAVGAVGRINKAGGPLGRQIRLFNEDSQTDADVAVRAARKLIDVNRVIAVVGTWASSVTLAVAPICQRSKVVEMSTSGAAAITKIQQGGYVFRTEPDDTLWAKAEADFVGSKGWKRVAMLGAKTGYTADWTEIFTKRLATHGGTVVSAIFPTSATTFQSEVAKTFQSQPDVVVLTGYEPDTTQILRAVVQEGFAGKSQFLATEFAITDALIQNVGAGAQGLYIMGDSVDEGSPVYQDFLKTLGVSGGVYPYAAQAYDQMQLIALAIEASKQATAAGINGKLREISNPPGEVVYGFATGAKLLRQGKKVKYTGASGPIDFDQNGNIAVGSFAIQQVRNGKRMPVGTMKVTADRWPLGFRA